MNCEQENDVDIKTGVLGTFSVSDLSVSPIMGHERVSFQL